MVQQFNWNLLMNLLRNQHNFKCCCYSETCRIAECIKCDKYFHYTIFFFKFELKSTTLKEILFISFIKEICKIMKFHFFLLFFLFFLLLFFPFFLFLFLFLFLFFLFFYLLFYLFFFYYHFFPFFIFFIYLLLFFVFFNYLFLFFVFFIFVFILL